MTIDYQAFTLICVDYTDKFSNFFEDLVKLARFPEDVEDELLELSSREVKS